MKLLRKHDGYWMPDRQPDADRIRASFLCGLVTERGDVLAKFHADAGPSDEMELGLLNDTGLVVQISMDFDAAVTLLGVLGAAVRDASIAKGQPLPSVDVEPQPCDCADCRGGDR